MFILKAFSVTLKSAREWLFSRQLSFLHYSMSSKKVAVINRSWSNADSAASLSLQLTWYLGIWSCKVSKVFLTMSPKFSSISVVLSGGKRPKAHLTASCRCLSFGKCKIAGRAWGSSIGIFSFRCDSDDAPSSLNRMILKCFADIPFLRWSTISSNHILASLFCFSVFQNYGFSWTGKLRSPVLSFLPLFCITATQCLWMDSQAF